MAGKHVSSVPVCLLVIACIGCVTLLYLEFTSMQKISEPFYRQRRRNNMTRIIEGISGLNYARLDASDFQYHNFRLNMFYMIIYFALILIGSKKIWETIFEISELRRASEELTMSKNDTNLRSEYTYNPYHKKIVRLYSIFYVFHGIGFAFYLHWFTAVYLFSSLMIFYAISLMGPSKMNPLLTWMFALLVLFTCDVYNGYSLFKYFLGEYHWLSVLIDEYRGSLPWHVYFRMVMLRVVSFNMDKYWALNNSSIYKSEKEETKRTVSHLPGDYFGVLEFIAYTLYPPLYIAGPIISYNNFISQIAFPMKKNSFVLRLKSVVWIIFLICLMDIILHYTCFNAISVAYNWENWDEPWKVSVVGLWTLQFLYLKFLIIWRFFKTFSMLDNIVPPENMPRCMHSTSSFEHFWRAWHSSFNKWTVRYLYIPLGGKGTQKYSIWLIFLFVGLWHDLWLSWVAWALMNGLFFSIELLTKEEWKKEKYNFVRACSCWKIISIIFTCFSGTFMFLSNLSLVYGVEHMPNFVRIVLFSPGSWKVYALILLSGFSIVPVQQYINKKTKQQ